MNDMQAIQDGRQIGRVGTQLDKTTAGAIVMQSGQGAWIANMAQSMEFAHLMATGGITIRPHLRGKPGACLGIVVQAMSWGMQPYGVANKSFTINDQLGFEAQLIQAVVEENAPLQKKLRCEYAGNIEDGTRTCTVTGLFIGETEPHKYTSPQIGKIRTKNSPLWRDDPDQQLWYYAVRAFARKWCPAVILGVYTPEEIKAGVGQSGIIIEGSSEATIDQNPLGARDEDELVVEPGVDPKTGEITDNEAFEAAALAARQATNGGIGASAGAAGQGGGTGTPGQTASSGGAAGAAGPGVTGGSGGGSPSTATGGSGTPTSSTPAGGDSGSQKRTTTRAGAKSKTTEPAQQAQPAAQPATQQAEEVFPEPYTAQKPDDYFEYAKRWIGRHTDPSAARARWAKERDIRNKMPKMTEEQFTEIQTLLGKVGKS